MHSRSLTATVPSASSDVVLNTLLFFNLRNGFAMHKAVDLRQSVPFMLYLLRNDIVLEKCVLIQHKHD